MALEKRFVKLFNVECVPAEFKVNKQWIQGKQVDQQREILSTCGSDFFYSIEILTL